MSDIGILNDPLSLAFIALLFGWPGLLLGGIAGALLWRRHRLIGALIGAAVGGVACLLGVMWWNDAI